MNCCKHTNKNKNVKEMMEKFLLYQENLLEKYVYQKK